MMRPTDGDIGTPVRHETIEPIEVPISVPVPAEPEPVGAP